MQASLLWSGGITEAGASVVAKLDRTEASVRLAVAPNINMAGAVYTAPVVPDSDRYVTFPVTGLSANTEYWAAVEDPASGNLSPQKARFRTHPTGAASFSFAVGACNNSLSNHRVYDFIRSHNPLFFIHDGDFHYQDIATNDQTLFRAQYEAAHTSTYQRRADLYHEMPLVYMWDDHDFGPDDSDSTSPARPAAAATYRQCVPHYPLASETGNNPIYQAFTVGRVRFIVTDLRHQRSPNTDTDNASKSMMGATQKAWFKQQLLDAKNDPSIALTVWVSSSVWLATDGVSVESTSDTWAKFTTERTEIVNYCSANGITKLLILCGDGHQLSIDDGTNSPGGFKTMVAGALDQSSSPKGGPFSSGIVGNPVSAGQYGLIDVTDNGTVLSLVLRGKQVTSAGVESEVMTLSYTP